MSESELLKKVNDIDKRLNFLIELISDAFLTHDEHLLLKEADEIVKNGKICEDAVDLKDI